MTLNEYCTGIADAIREKEGSTGLIPAPDHAARIKAITTGVDTSADTVVADALTEGYTAHDAAGNLVNGANPYAKEKTNTTVNTQADLIAQIQTALEGKAAGGANVETCTLTYDIASDSNCDLYCIDSEGVIHNGVTGTGDIVCINNSLIVLRHSPIYTNLSKSENIVEFMSLNTAPTIRLFSIVGDAEITAIYQASGGGSND